MKEETTDCNCLDTVEPVILEKIKSNPKNPKGFEITEHRWEHSTIYPKRRIYTNFIIKSTFTKKDNTTSRETTGHVAIHFNYCPFCGKKFEKGGGL